MKRIKFSYPSGKKHTLLYWINRIFLVLLGCCTIFLLIFAKMSMDNLLKQEIENRKAILKLNVDNINGNLEALQSYLYQSFTNSEEITMIETGTDETKLFMAVQSLTRSLQKITGWNDSLKFLFFYSPASQDQTFLRVSSAQGDVTEKLMLQEQVKSYINEQLEKNNELGKGYLLLKSGENGYIIRFYKIRNSYLGMCLDSSTVLKPLEEQNSDEECLAFMCDIDGNVISRSEGLQESIDIDDNGRLLQRNGERYLQLNYLSREGDFYIGTWTKANEISQQLQWMRNLITVFIAGFLGFLIFMSFAIRKFLYQPIGGMEQAMKRVGDGEWDLAVREESGILEYDSMIHNFNDMVSEIKDLKIQNYEKELSAQKAYLQYLQLQINPHFYLNALNIIYSLAEIENYALIQEMTMSLVEYSRYMFRKPDSMVTISQEMEHVDNYMKIQKMRFPDRIDYQVSVSSEIEDAMIPPFIIQSFVENSIKYAVNFEQHNILAIQGKTAEIDDELFVQLEIRDNGTGYSQAVLDMMNEKEPVDERYNVGLRNVRQRLELVFGDRAKMILKNEDGAVTILLIPLVWKEETE